MKKLALALDNYKLIEALRTRYEVVQVYQNDKELSQLKEMLDEPDVLIVSDTLPGITIQRILNIKIAFEKIRIIYIMNDPDYSTGTKRKVRKLVENQIYDFAITDGTVDFKKLCDLIENPRSFEDVKSEIDEDENEEVYPNTTMVFSLKPGSGKTFVAINLAVAIADYGQDKRNEGKMERPRVLLLDGDLTNLNVGLLTRVNNFDRNMLTALKKIESCVDDDGTCNLTEAEGKNLSRYVRGCLSRYKNKNNLYVMAASDIPLDELLNISPAHFYFLVKMLVQAFDVVIVDSNSAFDHQTTAALLELSGKILLLLDNDYNNIQNNLRYIGKLADLGYDEKIHFVVNKDITRALEKDCLEDLAYNTQNLGNIMIEHRIPYGDPGTIKSIDFSDQILVTTDKLPEVKDALLEVANDIWKIDYSRVEKAAEEEPKKKENKIVSFLNK